MKYRYIWSFTQIPETFLPEYAVIVTPFTMLRGISGYKLTGMNQQYSR